MRDFEIDADVEIQTRSHFGAPAIGVKIYDVFIPFWNRESAESCFQRAKTIDGYCAWPLSQTKLIEETK